MGNIINGQEWLLGSALINPNIQLEVLLKIDDYVINKYADFGKVLVMDAATVNKTFTMPTLVAADIGKIFIFSNVDTGRLTIQMGTGDAISDSAAAGTIYSDTDNISTLFCIVVTTNLMLVFGATGTWTTT